MAHSTKYVCWDCRHCISVPDPIDHIPRCNKCGKEIDTVHYHFKPPKQNNVDAWNKAALRFKMAVYRRTIDELFPTFQTQAGHNRPNKVDKFKLKGKGKKKFADMVRK